MKYLLNIALLLVYFFFHAQTCQEIIDATFKKISEVQTASFYIIARERYSDEYKTEKAFYKIRNHPFSIYYKQLYPPTQAEVLINEKYQKLALVNPNSFPYVSLKLSPFGEILRDKQHHNIYQAGFVYLKTVLIYLKNKYQISWSDVCQPVEKAKIKQYDCYKITLINRFYKIYTYTLPKEMSLQELGLQMFVCDYKMLELNPDVKSIFKKLPAGTKLQIPSDYAQKIVLYIDKTLMLPVKSEVYDEKGQFEEYLFEELKINPTFTSADFDENNKEYGFK